MMKVFLSVGAGFHLGLIAFCFWARSGTPSGERQTGKVNWRLGMGFRCTLDAIKKS